MGKSKVTQNQNDSTENEDCNVIPDDNLSTHFSQCLRLASENKITSRNAFSLKLIDLIPQLKKEQLKMFQMASSTLDAGSKIYAHRVDVLYDDTYRMVTSLRHIIEESMRKKKTVPQSDCRTSRKGPKRKAPTKVLAQASKIRLKAITLKEDLSIPREKQGIQTLATQLQLNELQTNYYPSQLLSDFDLPVSLFTTSNNHPFERDSQQAEFERHIFKLEENPSVSIPHNMLERIHNAGKKCYPLEVSSAVSVCPELETMTFMRWKPITSLVSDRNVEFIEISTTDIINSSAPPARNDAECADSASSLSHSYCNQPLIANSTMNETVDLLSDDEFESGVLKSSTTPIVHGSGECKYLLDCLESISVDAFGHWNRDSVHATEERNLSTGEHLNTSEFPGGQTKPPALESECIQSSFKIPFGRSKLDDVKKRPPTLASSHITIVDSPVYDMHGSSSIPHMDFVYSNASGSLLGASKQEAQGSFTPVLQASSSLPPQLDVFEPEADYLFTRDIDDVDNYRNNSTDCVITAALISDHSRNHGHKLITPGLVRVKKEMVSENSSQTSNTPPSLLANSSGLKSELKMESNNLSKDQRTSVSRKRRHPTHKSLTPGPKVKEANGDDNEDDDLIITSVSPRRPITPLKLMNSPQTRPRLKIPYVRTAKRVTVGKLNRLMRKCLKELFSAAGHSESDSQSISFTSLVDLFLDNISPKLRSEMSTSLIYYSLLNITSMDQTLSISSFDDESNMRIYQHATPDSDPDYIRLVQYAADHGCGSMEASIGHGCKKVKLTRPTSRLFSVDVDDALSSA